VRRPSGPVPPQPGGPVAEQTWLVAVLLCVTTSSGADGLTGRGPVPDVPSAWVPWADDVILSSAERQELDARGAALEARVGEVAGLRGQCGDLRSLVRESLAGIQHVRAVEVGFVLFTSHPPQMAVTFATALESGRVVRDRLTVIVPVRPRVVPLDWSRRLTGVPSSPPCRPAP
jgi:hypothetical protein